MTSKGELVGKRALVSGASSGIGQATITRFLAEGACVGLIARRKDIIDAMALPFQETAMPLVADIADDQAVAKAVAAFVARFGGVDIVVNAAGVDGPAPLKSLTPEIWRRQLDVNLSGTFYLTREAALYMIEGDGGVIVNLGSELAVVGAGFYAHYCASKFGVVGLTKALAAELAPKVRVNCLCPGPVNTPMMDSELEWFPDPALARKDATDRILLKRFASPEEIADAVLFFATKAQFATGSIFNLDGGITAV